MSVLPRDPAHSGHSAVLHTSSHKCPARARSIMLLLYMNTGRLEGKCDTPLSYWLYVSFIAGFVTCGVGIVVNCFVSLTAKNGEQGEKKPSCLGTCCLAALCPFSVFLACSVARSSNDLPKYVPHCIGECVAIVAVDDLVLAPPALRQIGSSRETSSYGAPSPPMTPSTPHCSLTSPTHSLMEVSPPGLAVHRISIGRYAHALWMAMLPTCSLTGHA